MAKKTHPLQLDAAPGNSIKRAKRAQAGSGSASAAKPPRCVALAGNICDQVAHLLVLFKAYIAVERFVSPEYADEAQALVPPSRAELGALLHTINIEMQQQLGALAFATTVLQAEMVGGGVPGS